MSEKLPCSSGVVTRLDESRMVRQSNEMARVEGSVTLVRRVRHQTTGR